MFLGHLAAAFAAKRIAPQASLGSLVLAALFADLLWSLLLLAGIERAQVVPGATVMAPLVFERYPWSHSLAVLLLVGAVAGVAHFRRWSQSRTAWVLALLVPGHWLLDWLVHVPDLPLVPGAPPSLHGRDAGTGTRSVRYRRRAVSARDPAPRPGRHAGAGRIAGRARPSRRRQRPGAIAARQPCAGLGRPGAVAVRPLGTVGGPPPHPSGGDGVTGRIDRGSDVCPCGKGNRVLYGVRIASGTA